MTYEEVLAFLGNPDPKSVVLSRVPSQGGVTLEAARDSANTVRGKRQATYGGKETMIEDAVYSRFVQQGATDKTK